MARPCPNPACKLPTDTIKTAISHGRIVTGCPECINTLKRPNELAAKNRRDYQRGEFRRDIVQPYERDYAKAYGIDQARERGWSDEALRKFG